MLISLMATWCWDDLKQMLEASVLPETVSA